MNAVHMMASQGGVAVGGVIWGAAATSLGLGTTLVGGALLLAASLTLAVPLSINFAHDLNLDPAPLKTFSPYEIIIIFYFLSRNLIFVISWRKFGRRDWVESRKITLCRHWIAANL
jgi:hypothetical protein